MTFHPALSRRTLMAGAAALAVTVSTVPSFAQDALSAKGYAVGDIVLGDVSAPVTIIEYASLTCPHCATFHTDSLPEIKRDYLDTGKAKLILREIYFDQFGLWSSMVARCGGEDSFYRMIDMFLNGQRSWYLNHVRAFNETNDSSVIIGEIRKIGRRAGLSNDRMDACLKDEAFLERLVSDFQTTSAADGVRSTPTFFINGEELSGAVPAATMAAMIDKHL